MDSSVPCITKVSSYIYILNVDLYALSLDIAKALATLHKGNIAHSHLNANDILVMTDGKLVLTENGYMPLGNEGELICSEDEK
ncbi:hypothetical protein M422DRAFT_256877 [Sphaerobolus stellatus SS14]|uniref:Protein kinase domain-containing protein n=1 Tax=Sphaerobolus stellatus (strain SS14) TaxID=990650 RepID=A0A0C9VQ40_SPHS4|nr:hypothetical protein M422DRAFT_256877 [Sphaerobolus stellatus SS14]